MTVAIVDDGDIAAIDSPAALKESLGGDVVSLAVDGPVEDVCDRLDARTWVIKYETNEVDETNEVGVNVTVEHGEARIADLVRLADDAGVTITSVDIRQPNLETVFLSLTGITIEEREATGDGKSGMDGEPEIQTDTITRRTRTGASDGKE